MPKGAQTCLDVMQFLLSGKAPEWIMAGERFVGLHTSDPSKGDQDTAEVAYPGYRRQPVPVTGWDVDGDMIVNHDFIDFPTNIGVSTPKITHISIGTDGYGPGQIIYVAKIRASRPVRQNQRPRFEAGEIVITEA